MPHKADVAASVDGTSDVGSAPGRGELRRATATARSRARTPTARASWRRWPAAWASIPAARRCLVVGAGGAARAVILALADAGAAEVAVLNRTAVRAVEAAALAGAAGAVVTGDVAGAVGAGRPGRQRDPAGHELAGRTPKTWPLAPELLRAGPGGGRPGLRAPPDGLAGAGGGPGRHAARRARACWCTRRRRSWCSGPAARPRSKQMWQAAEAAFPDGG